MSASPSVFISYRREDSAGHAGRLFDHLAARIGRDQVFRDVDHIGPGEDFIESIRKRIEASDVVLVIIGPRWLNPRLAGSDDLVRFEVAEALRRKVRVIPVLVGGAQMPQGKDLPEDLAPLAQRNAFETREGTFDRDVAVLLAEIAPRLGWGGPTAKKRLLAVSAVGILLLIAFLAYRQRVNTPQYALRQVRELNLNFNVPTLLEYAGRGDAEVVRLFLQAGMDPNSFSPNVEDTAMNAAAANGHVDVVRMLVDRGASTRLALGYAASRNKPAVVDLLLSRKPNQDAMAFALYKTAGADRIPMLKKLLDSGLDPNSRWGSSTALMSAAYGSKTEAVELLLRRGAKVNMASDSGETALHYATRARAALETVRALVKGGADVNAQTENGTTALMNAIEDSATASFLMEEHADVNARTKDGDTVLMLAAARDSPVVKTLLDRGADANAQNHKGETALMFAAGEGNSNAVKALLERGANVSALNRDGDTAWTIASKAGRKSILQVLSGKR